MPNGPQPAISAHLALRALEPHAVSRENDRPNQTHRIDLGIIHCRIGIVRIPTKLSHLEQNDHVLTGDAPSRPMDPWWKELRSIGRASSIWPGSNQSTGEANRY